MEEVPGIPPQSTWRTSAQPLPTLLLSYRGSCLLQRLQKLHTLPVTAVTLASSLYYWSPHYLFFLLKLFFFDPCPFSPLQPSLASPHGLPLAALLAQRAPLCCDRVPQPGPSDLSPKHLETQRQAAHHATPFQHQHILPTCSDHIAHSGSGLC